MSAWAEEAYKLLDRCRCGGMVHITRYCGGYRIKCVCGKQVVEPTAVDALTSWNKITRSDDDEGK